MLRICYAEKCPKERFIRKNNHVQKMGIVTLYVCEIERLVWLRCEEGGAETQGKNSTILGSPAFSKPS